MAQYLFMDTDIQVLIETTRRELVSEIGQLTDSAVLSQTNERWLRYLLDKYTINVPTLDPDKAETTYVDGNVPQYQVPNPNFDNQSGVPGRIYTLHVPYSGPEKLFHYKPRSYPMNAPIAGTSNSEITIDAGGAWHTPATIEAHFDGTIERIETNLRNLRNDVAPFNQELETLNGRQPFSLDDPGLERAARSLVKFENAGIPFLALPDLGLADAACLVGVIRCKTVSHATSQFRQSAGELAG